MVDVVEKHGYLVKESSCSGLGRCFVVKKGGLTNKRVVAKKWLLFKKNVASVKKNSSDKIIGFL